MKIEIGKRNEESHEDEESHKDEESHDVIHDVRNEKCTGVGEEFEVEHLCVMHDA